MTQTADLYAAATTDTLMDAVLILAAALAQDAASQLVAGAVCNTLCERDARFDKAFTAWTLDLDSQYATQVEALAAVATEIRAESA